MNCFQCGEYGSDKFICSCKIEHYPNINYSRIWLSDNLELNWLHYARQARVWTDTSITDLPYPITVNQFLKLKVFW